MTPSRTPMPYGTSIVLDRHTRILRRGRFLLGGRPRRVLRLSEAGAHALARLRTGPIRDPEEATLARRLVSAGLAHPRPPSPQRPMRTVTIVPVRDRADELDRCLRALGGEHPVLVVDDGSTNPDAVAKVARRHHARLVVRAVTGGPAAARNSGLGHIAVSAYDAVAFLDSDCRPCPEWAQQLTAQLADPTVGAVAPRVVPDAASTRARPSEFVTAHCPLDMGTAPRGVEPGGAVPYVPTAALVVRASALRDLGFDEALRYGEDVDAVWRMLDAGWAVRYEPSVRVRHAGPSGLAEHLARRYRYGTSAGPLARRHPTRLAPMVIQPLPAAAAVLVLLRCPAAASAVASVAVALLGRRLARARVPAVHAVPMGAAAMGSILLGIGRMIGQLGLPAAVLPVLTARHRGRRAATLTALLAGPHLVSWVRDRPRVPPIRWVALALADDLAYGAGVWRGALGARTVRPLLPRFAGR